MGLGTPTLIEEQDTFETLAERVDAAVNEVRKLDDEGEKKGMALKQAIEDFHKHAITKIVQHLKADPRGKELLFELVDEPSVYALFAMHGIVRADVNTRVSRTLDMVRPYMQSHGGDVELVEVQGDTVYVKLHGACNGCSMSAVTLREGVEEALVNNIPEINKVEVVPSDPGPGLITIDSLTATLDSKWVEGPHIDDVKAGKPYRLEKEEHNIVLLKVENKFYAYQNACAHMGMPIDGGMIDLEAGTITCPWHGFCFEAETGECLTAPQAQLEAFPLRVEEGRIWVLPR